MLYKLRPYGLSTTAYQMGFWLGAWIVAWPANAPRTELPFFEAACVAVPIFLLVGCIARLAHRRPFARVPDEVWALGAFLVENWILASQLFFALKRAYPFFVVALVLRRCP
jgi:hypothetical protein